ncbi:RhuM family protein [uncultured Clostridium sp.]|uniref:RhuM family protein n=1 Tax=uncultured Clostridium sp. TaxID=59620 RepID=UPI003217A5A3
MDKERLKNGTFLKEDYFDDLLEEIREIRASKRKLKHYYCRGIFFRGSRQIHY